jgi:carboxymethylenebutenolidase
MSLDVDYYLTLPSPWAYLGHARFTRIARDSGARVQLRPIDLGGKVFPVSGGLPLAKRAPQRQAYRLLEMRRFAEHLGVPLNLHPKHFPVASDDAARLVIAVDTLDGTDAAMALTEALMRAVWVEDRNIADAAEHAALLAALKLPPQRLVDARADAVQARYASDTQRAIEAGVFGAPSYVVEGELFWGQDRLDFLQRRLARG